MKISVKLTHLIAFHAVIFLTLPFAGAQVLPPPPGGGGSSGGGGSTGGGGGGGTPVVKDTNPYNPNNWQIGPMTQDGHDVAYRVEHDQSGNDVGMTYTHVWGTGDWTVRVGTNEYPTEMAFPMSQGYGHSGSIYSMSTGWMQRKITWVGVGPGPASVVLKATLHAWTTYAEGSSASVVNSVVENDFGSEVITTTTNLFPYHRKETKGSELIILPVQGGVATLKVGARAIIACDGTGAVVQSNVDPLTVTIDDRTMLLSINDSIVNFGKEVTTEDVPWREEFWVDSAPYMLNDGHWVVGPHPAHKTGTYKKAQKKLHDLYYYYGVSSSKNVDIGLTPQNRANVIISNTGLSIFSPTFPNTETIIYRGIVTSKHVPTERYEFKFDKYSEYDTDGYLPLGTDWTLPDRDVKYLAPYLQSTILPPSPISPIEPIWVRFDPRDYPKHEWFEGDNGSADKVKLDYWWQDGLHGKTELNVQLHRGIEDSEDLTSVFTDTNSRGDFESIPLQNLGIWTMMNADNATAIIRPVDQWWKLQNQIGMVLSSTLSGGCLPILSNVAGFSAAMYSLNMSSPIGQDTPLGVNRQVNKGYFKVMGPSNWKSFYSSDPNADEYNIMTGTTIIYDGQGNPGQTLVNIEDFCWALSIRPKYDAQVILHDNWDTNGYVGQKVGVAKNNLGMSSGTRYYFFYRGNVERDNQPVPPARPDGMLELVP